MPQKIDTLWHLAGREGYWVVTRAGYDMASFTDRDEAQRFYDEQVAAEQKAKADCPFARKH